MKTYKLIKYIFPMIFGLLLVLPVSAVNWSYEYATVAPIDVINQTGTKDWLPTLVTTGDFNIIGFIRDILIPFETAFGGNLGLFGLMIWLIFIIMSWRNTGSIDIPLIIGMLSGGLYGLFIPQSIIFWILYVVIFAASAIVMRTFVNVD